MKAARRPCPIRARVRSVQPRRCVTAWRHARGRQRHRRPVGRAVAVCSSRSRSSTRPSLTPASSPSSSMPTPRLVATVRRCRVHPPCRHRCSRRHPGPPPLRQHQCQCQRQRQRQRPPRSPWTFRRVASLTCGASPGWTLHHRPRWRRRPYRPPWRDLHARNGTRLVRLQRARTTAASGPSRGTRPSSIRRCCRPGRPFSMTRHKLRPARRRPCRPRRVRTSTLQSTGVMTVAACACLRQIRCRSVSTRPMPASLRRPRVRWTRRCWRLAAR
ncbi:MAG: hypothetical protein RLZZ584_1374 [Pseudomonadota bacterium]